MKYKRLALVFAMLNMAVAERVVPLHAPIAALSRDGRSVYTQAIGGWEGLLSEIYHLDSRTVETLKLKPPEDNQITWNDLYEHNDPVRGSGEAPSMVYLTPDQRHLLVVGLGIRTFSLPRLKPAATYARYPATDTLDDTGRVLALDPNSRFVVLNADEALLFLRLPDLTLLHRLELGPSSACCNNRWVGHTRHVSIGIGPGGRRLVLSEPGRFRLFRFDAQRPPRTLAQLGQGLIYDSQSAAGRKRQDVGQPQAALGLSWSPDGTLVAGGFVTQKFEADAPANLEDVGRVRSTTTGQVVYTLTGQANAITETAFSPNGRYLATLGGTPPQLRQFCNTDLSYSPPKSEFGDGTVHLRDARTGRTLRVYPHACAGLLFSKDSKKLMYSDRLNNLHIVDLP